MSNEPNETAAEISNLPTEAIRRGDANEAQVTHALERHTTTVLPQVLNWRERRLVQENLMAELTQGFDHRRQALNMALETRLQSIREACNHVLVTGKTHLRHKRIEYFGEMQREVEFKMNQLADEFLEDMDRRFERLGRFKNEKLRAKEQNRLEKSVDDFLNTLDRLMHDFRSIIDENVGADGVRS